MAALTDVLKNYQIFVDGRGYAGKGEEFKPPELSIQTEDFRGAGMDIAVPIDMGMEMLECSFNLISYDRDVLSLFGFAQNSSVPLVVRGALQDPDGTVRPVSHHMRGMITKISTGAYKGGDKPSMEVTYKPTYYRIDHGGTTVIEIDALNGVRKINGVDSYAEIRRAIGQ